MTYEPVIGLEVHVQTNTKSKMFCGCSASYFGKPPNSNTCPTCLGLPGALPVPNGRAIEIAVQVALALNCTINKETKFDRKNYFYPDLPKGYQISQYDEPIGVNGFLEIEVNGEPKRIMIRRVHQEEDTGKSIHHGNKTLLDFNKSGVPLVEIVTEPDFRSGAEVTAFTKKLRQLLRSLNASDADMEKGQMRIEPNMSLRSPGTSTLPDYKVEVKNISSISVLDKVIDKEIIRQTEILESGQTPVQETRGLVDMTGKTLSQRTKESEQDYRYFPEPDIPPIVFTEQYIAKIRATIPELPDQKRERYTHELKVSSSAADSIIKDKQWTEYFEKSLTSAEGRKLAPEVAKWIVGDLTMLRRKYGKPKIAPEDLSQLLTLLSQGKITRIQAKTMLEEAYRSGVPVKDIMKQMETAPAPDSTGLAAAVQNTIKANPKAIADIKANPNAVMFLVGQVMKEMKGAVDPGEARKAIENALENLSGEAR